MNKDTDTDMYMAIGMHGRGHRNLGSHCQGNFEISLQSQFCHCASEVPI